jgi:hypothetical protein
VHGIIDARASALLAPDHGGHGDGNCGDNKRPVIGY